MKIKLLSGLLILLACNVFSQSTGINYKALIKDDLGNVFANQTVTILQFTIIEGITSVYTETHSPMTDSNGIVIVNIGKGTPTLGAFTNINWANDEHFLNVQVNIGSGLEDLGTTQFMAVPYALEASNITGLEAIDEGNGIGWRLKGRNPANYGNIGIDAVDLSNSNVASTIRGATGSHSTAMGDRTSAIGSRSTAMGQVTTASGVNSTAMGGGTTASGDYSTAMGQNTTASGFGSTAMGRQTAASGNRSIAMGDYITAPSVTETVIGRFNTDYALSISGNILWNTTDRLFTVGNGQLNAKSDALVILKNGTITAPSLDLGEITNNKTLITKEYLEATTSLPSGLEKITENDNTGWRLIGQDPANYGNIGKNAIDLSFSDVASSIRGAIGQYSTALGYQTIASDDYSTALGYQTVASNDYSTAMGRETGASGEGSTAMGWDTTASGNYSTAMGITTIASGLGSTAMGWDTEAPSYFETTVGMLNATYTPNSPTSWNAADRLFTVGSGSGIVGHPDYPMRNNALVILKNGKTGINTSNPESLFELVHANVLPTPTNKTNALSITNSNSNNSFQLATHNNGSLTLYSNGNYLGYFNNSSGVYTVISDRRLKKEITPLNNKTLDKVMQLNPVSYLMKDQTDTKRNIGLISQEVQEVFPSITNFNEETDTLTLSYTELIPVLIKATQQQQEIIEKLTQRLKALENKNN